jgi:ubiquitin
MGAHGTAVNRQDIQAQATAKKITEQDKQRGDSSVPQQHDDDHRDAWLGRLCPMELHAPGAL